MSKFYSVITPKVVVIIFRLDAGGDSDLRRSGAKCKSFVDLAESASFIAQTLDPMDLNDFGLDRCQLILN